MPEWFKYSDVIRSSMKYKVKTITLGEVKKVKGKFRAYCGLPGAKSHIGEFKGEPAAMVAVERQVSDWFARIGENNVQS